MKTWMALNFTYPDEEIKAAIVTMKRECGNRDHNRGRQS